MFRRISRAAVLKTVLSSLMAHLPKKKLRSPLNKSKNRAPISQECFGRFPKPPTRPPFRPAPLPCRYHPPARTGEGNSQPYLLLLLVLGWRWRPSPVRGGRVGDARERGRGRGRTSGPLPPDRGAFGEA